MFRKTDYQMRYFTNTTETVPAEEIKDLLQRLSLKKLGRLKQEQYRALKEGVKFLDLALRGRKIIKKTLDKGIVSGDLAAIKAFNTANLAFRNYSEKTNDIENILIITHLVLSKLLEWNGRSSDIGLSDKHIKVAWKFFDALVIKSSEYYGVELSFA
jgi:hypothetical protein